MTAFTNRFPRKSSRTSTQAVIVPSTALTRATRMAAPRLSFSAATASGDETTAQNSAMPFWRDAQMSAAIGSRTTTDRKAVVKPSERAAAAPSLGRRRTPPVSCAAWVALARARASDRAFDLRHPALVRVEPELVGGSPPADDLVVDLEDPGPRRVLVGGAEPVLREQILRRVALYEADELIRLVLVRAVLEDGDRQLDQHRLARDHVLHVLAVQPRVDRLALVRDQDVAFAGQERVRGVTPRGVLRDDVLEELLDVRGRLLVGLAEPALRTVGGQDVPLGRAGAERVRRDHLDAGPHEVGPALDVLRVPVSNRED